MALPLSHPGLQHAALFYDTEQSFVASVTPFVREGVEHGEVVLVSSAASPVYDDLRADFGDERAVLFDASQDARPVSVIDRCRRAMDSRLGAGVEGFRAIHFADLGERRAQWLEWLRFEAVVNRALAPYPLQVLCPYDTAKMQPAQVTAMRRAHPMTLGPQGNTANEEYLDPVELVARPEYALRPAPLQLTRPKLILSDVGDLRSFRIDLYPLLLASPLSRKEVDDFVKAVGEVVDNAHMHGSGRVDVRLWSGSAATICTVSDQGTGMDDPFMGYARPAVAATAKGGPTGDRLGLWAARQLCDTLDYSRTASGFTVRLTVSHQAGGPVEH